MAVTKDKIDALLKDLENYKAELEKANQWLITALGPPVTATVDGKTVGAVHSLHYMLIGWPALPTILTLYSGFIDNLKKGDFIHSNFDEWAAAIRTAIVEWRAEFQRLEALMPTVPPWDVSMLSSGYQVPIFPFILTPFADMPSFSIYPVQIPFTRQGIVVWDEPSDIFKGLIVENITSP